jgi:hypothetical protein
MASVQTAPAVQQPGSAIPNVQPGVNIQEALQVSTQTSSTTPFAFDSLLTSPKKYKADEGIWRIRQGSRTPKTPPTAHEHVTTTHISTKASCLRSTTAAADAKSAKYYYLRS